MTIPGLNLPPRLALVAGARLPRPNVCHVARLLAVVIAAWLALVPVAHAQPDEDDDALPFLPGLAAEYRTESGTSCRRVDDAVAFNWGSAMPDARLGKPGPFAAEWRGQLVVPAAGTYRFWAFAAGEVAIALEGKEILRASADQPQWLAADSLELTFGRKPLEVRYRRTRAEGRVALFWAGPQFAREPLGGRWLWHARENTPPKQFERGAELARALRCTACHPTTGQRPPSPGPDLDRLAGNVHSAWLVDWLSSDADGKSAAAPTRRMPHFGLSREDAQAVAAYLLADNAAASAPKQPAGSLPKASANKGERHVHTLGCLACHQIGSLGTKGLWDGGDLSTLAAKHPGDFFARWLADPAAINKQHRMPVYDLPIADRNDIAAYLATLGKPPAAESARNAPTDGALMARGLNLVEKYRCAACHVLPGKPAAPGAAKALKAQSNWMAACTTAAATGAASHRPGYNLSPDDAGALRDYFAALDVSAVASNQANQPPLDGKRILVERNCTACHSRGSARGLAPIVGDVAAARPELAELVPAMTPPSLESVGDKLHDAALVAAIAGTQGVHRPWLAARMPVYKLPPEELAAIVAHFTESDRVPDADDAPARPTAEPPLPAEAGRLVTSEGFGCTSCHQVGKRIPQSAPLAARGPDLTLLGHRIRHAWFERFVRDPVRIVPRMEMPSIQLPVGGLMNDDLDGQLAAVWRLLNEPKFEPPKPSAVRTARRTGTGDANESAVVLTDVLEAGGRTYIKPFLVALPNRHNVLYDLEEGRLAGWWQGDAARQRTRGKSWYWEAAATPLVARAAGQAPEPGMSEWAVLDGDERREATRQGQFITEFDSFGHEINGQLMLRHRIHFPPQGETAPGVERPSKEVMQVSQTFWPIWSEMNGGWNGFRRRVIASMVGKTDTRYVEFRPLPAGAQATLAEDGRELVVAGKVDLRVRLAAPGEARFQIRGGGPRLLLPFVDGRAETLELQYLCGRPIDRAPLVPAEPPPRAPRTIDTVPGWSAVRLPLPEEIMPTGMAWRSDGAMYVTSLAGQVWLARDGDGDGLADSLNLFSDELAAPYGAMAEGSSVLVINKYALLRLTDEDRDGRAEHTKTLASGWGHTNDYHDWTVGLVSDGKRGYYVATSCQQDNRAPAAAHLRGKVLRITDTFPTPGDPRPFAVAEVSAGHRFPMGIARNRQGALFVTDNQGNYNPFNELNHVIPGGHYGFINAVDKKRPAGSATPAAVELPHPWTRSVNGICFLETPEKVRRDTHRDLYGPFEGHLVGCEYDTRRIVRMSLQRIGDTYQGAAYPMSAPPAAGQESFLGPIVCGVGPDGAVYVGCMRDSGWGGGNNVGAIVRMMPQGESFPPGLAEVQALKDGFELRFTVPVDRAKAADGASYAVSSYRRIATPAYGGPDKDRRPEVIQGATVAGDGLSARLRLAEMRAGFVYEFHLANLAQGQATFFPDEAHYTLRVVP